MSNLRENPALQNAHIRDIFHLHTIASETDLQDYKNLLNSMAALFYTNHRMSDVTQVFARWRVAAASKQEERMRANAGGRKGGKPMIGGGAPMRIEIDTELANQEAFKNYQHVNHFGEEPSEIPPADDDDENFNKMSGADMLEEDDDGEDEMRDAKNRRFVEDLLKVGPFAKQILNYSYPPLLYQRGDAEDEDDEEDDGGEEDEEDDDAAVREILAGHPDGQGLALPDFDDEYDDQLHHHVMDEDDREIQELIKGGKGDEQLLYRQIQKAVSGGNNNNNVQDTLPLDSHNLIEHVDEHGNVFLVDPAQFIQNHEDDDDDYGMEGGEGGHGHQQIIDGGDLDDEEFLQMMEEEAAAAAQNNNNGGRR